ncbi:hypothetical protein TSUD_262650 [Trifolium subterraneum]|nr:hypothetical protein TSUD_262650 [Trifolium subterraneum]
MDFANHERMVWTPIPISFPALEEIIMRDLAAPLTNNEIKHAVFSMSPWKAPGPDGFPAGFYQKSWDIVGRSICDFVRKVWNTTSEIGVVNKTDICLIPKVPHPETVAQFRPISLCNTNYKIVSKVIVERLKVCMPMLVSPFQTGFVPGRNIHENIMVAKEMIHTMHRMQNSKWRGIKAGRAGPMVSHLMFADDLLLFGEASEKQVQCVLDILNVFCSLSGQEVSQEKTSILFSKNVRRRVRDKLLSMSGFRETNDLGKYLGVPLNGRAPKNAEYHYLIDQVKNKLSAWKAKQLSFAGRLTLAKSVLEAVPIYPRMTEKIPKACLDDIQRIQRNFIWGDYDNVRKFHAVNWNMVTRPKWMGGLGLRKLEVMNQACLLKLGWKLNCGATDFWCQVVKGKYGVHNFNNDIAIRSSNSSMWKALLRLKDQLTNNMCWCIRNESSVDAWNQIWIEPGCRVSQLCIVPYQLQGARVCDLVDENGSWNWQLLETWIPENIMNKIAAIPPPCEENGSDEPVGICSNSNGFSVTIMYEQLCGIVRDNVESNNWIKVWKLNVPERVRCFVWLLLHDRLLTNYRKSRMGLGHAMCNYCGDLEETTLHAIRDCALIIPFWLQVVPMEDRSSFFMEDTQDWISRNLMKGRTRRRGSDWCDFWATTCHSLWMWRNKEAHDEEFVRPMQPVNYVQKRVEEYQHAKQASDLLDGREYTLVDIGWKPPSGSFVKLNTDGARKDNNKAGCGGIIRGNHGEWLGGFAKGVGECSAFIAELWGVFEGLSLAKRMCFRKVELHIDSVAVVQVISTGKLKSKLGWSLVLNIRKLLDLDWEVTITHAYRETNKCADALANIGCQLGREIIFFEDCPPHMKDLVLADVMGITTPRMISV